MASGWLKLSLACLIFAACVMSSTARGKKKRGISAHIVASDSKTVSYRTDIVTVMKDWSTDDSHSHRTGGMEYKDGKLIVPKAGTYYIYAQLHFRTPGRIQIYVNENSVSLITSPVTNKEGPAATANGIGVFELEKDDAISLRTVPYKYGAPAGSLVGFYLRYDHCYFGAFLI